MSVRRFAVGLAVVWFFVGCAPEVSNEPNDGRVVQSIVRTTNSPFCPGKTLDSCPSPKAAEWRADINAWVDAEVPESEIRARLQERVPGFDLKPKPLSSGWIIPLVALIVSTLWFFVVSRRLRPRTRTPATSPATHQDPFDTRLDEELARID